MRPPLMRLDALNRLLNIVTQHGIRPRRQRLSRHSIRARVRSAQRRAVRDQHLGARDGDVEGVAGAAVRRAVARHADVGQRDAAGVVADRDEVVEAGQVQVADPAVGRPFADGDGGAGAVGGGQDDAGAGGRELDAQVLETHFGGLAGRRVGD